MAGSGRGDPSANGLTALRQAELAVENLAATRDTYHATGRAVLGFGDPEMPPAAVPRAAVLRLLAAGAASLSLPMALVYLGDDLTVRMGVGPLALALLLVLPPLSAAAAAVPAARLVSRRRAAAVAPAVLVVAYATAAAALAPGQLALAAALAVAGVGMAVAPAAQRSLLVDLVAPAHRLGALGAHRAVELAGGAVAVEVAAILVAAGEVTWRGALLVLATLGVAAGVGATGVREARAGQSDAELLAAIVDRPGAMPTGPDLRVGESLRRVWQTQSFSAFMTAAVAFGVLLLPLPLYLLHWFDERWRTSAAASGDLLALILLAAAAAAVTAHRPRQRGLGRLDAGAGPATRRAGMLVLAAAAALVVSAWLPYLAGAVVAMAAAYAAVAVAVPMMDCVALSIVEPNRRPEAAALLGMGTFLGMALGGVALLAGMDSRFGPAGAIVATGLVLASTGAALVRAGRRAEGDVDRLVDLIVDRAEVAVLARSGRHLPMLSCRGVDFSYGQLQVLFDVDFTVDDGEMVALLGTNGAGKSTLLRVISGLGLPQRGTIRFRGEDVTGVDAERRMRLGMTQVPGGRGVYGQLTVVENLRVFGHSRAGDRRRLDRGIEEALAAFPRLAERRNQRVSTMSGGEQQMLNLARAMVLRPRLLLIDELSLGLAPVVVSELLQSVRAINATGTAVVIVEQSVNIALSLVHHAYFMEKGQVRFDGPAHELLGRPDLLRSVFLEGAATGLMG